MLRTYLSQECYVICRGFLLYSNIISVIYTYRGIRILSEIPYGVQVQFGKKSELCQKYEKYCIFLQTGNIFCHIKCHWERPGRRLRVRSLSQETCLQLSRNDSYGRQETCFFVPGISSRAFFVHFSKNLMHFCLIESLLLYNLTILR